MTDIEIVRTLAEFEGRKLTNKHLKYWWFEPSDGGEPNEPAAYLESFDAVVPVWEKLLATNFDAFSEACRLLTGSPDRSWSCSLSDFIRNTPRQHAESLARAIIASKEQRNG